MTELFQLALILAGTIVAVAFARASHLTPMVYYIGMGVLFVNLGWLPHESSEFIEGLSQLGIILIMFALGFEENAANFMSSIKKSWGIAFFGALAPFCVAFSVAWYFFGDWNVAVICGLAMTATAVSISMVSLRSEGLANSPAATRIMTSVVLDDIASLVLVAVTIPLVTGTGEISVVGITWIIVKAILFFLVVAVMSIVFLPHDPAPWVKRIPLLGDYGLRHLLRFGHGRHAVLQSIFLALITALCGHTFGFHPAVGAYMAGLVMAEEYFVPGRDEGSYEDTKRIVNNVAFSWIGPIFFVTLGTKIEFDGALLLSLVPQIAAMTAGIIIFQVLSAGLAARYTGGMDFAGSVMIGLGMLGRAELAFVVLNIAYVQNSILSREAFYTLMVSCFLLNILVPIAIHWWKPRYSRTLHE